jgi:hypothetical protein
LTDSIKSKPIYKNGTLQFNPMHPSHKMDGTEIAAFYNRNLFLITFQSRFLKLLPATLIKELGILRRKGSRHSCFSSFGPSWTKDS